MAADYDAPRNAIEDDNSESIVIQRPSAAGRGSCRGP